MDDFAGKRERQVAVSHDEASWKTLNICKPQKVGCNAACAVCDVRYAASTKACFGVQGKRDSCICNRLYRNWVEFAKH